ncbi:MAG: FkbM family methyltransferase [Deltaproteobacteria bacterium]|nr:FkbM family methyltransferase [Deltaproteobacteria bacterium]
MNKERFTHYLNKIRYDYLMSIQWWLSGAIAPRRTVRSRNLRFTLPCNNWITHHRWKNYNAKEPMTLDWIDTVVKDGDLFFDIGANIGVYSLYAAFRHPNLKGIAFEPEYSNLHLLKENVMKNNLEKRVEVFGVALGNKVGLSYLHIQDLQPGSAKHTASPKLLKKTVEKCPVLWREGVCTYTVDLFCREKNLKPNCIKLDVDGNEPEILEGARETLLSPELRSVLIESSDIDSVQNFCEQVLRDSGFRRARHDPKERLEMWVRK